LGGYPTFAVHENEEGSPRVGASWGSLPEPAPRVGATRGSLPKPAPRVGAGRRTFPFPAPRVCTGFENRFRAVAGPFSDLARRPSDGPPVEASCGGLLESFTIMQFFEKSQTMHLFMFEKGYMNRPVIRSEMAGKTVCQWRVVPGFGATLGRPGRVWSRLVARRSRWRRRLFTLSPCLTSRLAGLFTARLMQMVFDASCQRVCIELFIVFFTSNFLHPIHSDLRCQQAEQGTGFPLLLLVRPAAGLESSSDRPLDFAVRAGPDRPPRAGATSDFTAHELG